MTALNQERIIVGVTGPDKGGFIPWIFTKLAIKFAKVNVYRLSPSRPQPPFKVDGLIIGGGADIDPARYGEKVFFGQSNVLDSNILRRYVRRFFRRFRREVGIGYIQIEPERDYMEFNLLEDSIKRKIPILGICRGAQLINVFFGGTLHQDIRSLELATPNINSFLPRKRIYIEPESKLSNLMQVRECYVNSLHKQSVGRIGNGLTISARDSNHIIQAIEHPNHPFLVGVQWHPEYIPQKPEQRLIFKKFIDAIIED